jgi:hypothetical protein
MELNRACGQEKHAVEKKLDKFEGPGVGSHIAREADAIAVDGYAGAIRIIFFRTHFAYHHGVADFLLLMAWDVVVVNKEEGISACNPFCVGKGPVPMPWHSHPSSLA